MESFKAFIKLILPILAALFVGGVSSPESFEQSLATLAGVVFLVPIVTEFFNVSFALKKNAALVASWAVGILLTFISWLLGFGFQELLWWQALITGFGASLVANRYFTVETVQLWLAKLFGDTPKIEKLTNP